jgi:cob(I)alamin adenosyltransferase
MKTRGLVQVYTGSGKGKTTAAIGAGIRAVGHGMHVHMIQFLKGGDNFPTYGEVQAIRSIGNFNIEQFGLPHFVVPGKVENADRAVVKRGIARAKEVLTSASFDMVILDEINVVMDLEMATADEILDLLSKRNKTTEVILTGRGAPAALLAYADLVSEINAVKHPFDHGIDARVGIEY